MRRILTAALAAFAAFILPLAAEAAGIAQVTTIVTRTNDTAIYAANDVVGAATGATAALTFTILPGEGMVRVMSTSLEIDAAAIIAGETSYNLQLYRETPPSALGDNAPWDLPAGDRATYVGALNLGTPADVGASLFIRTDSINADLYLPAGVIYGYLVTVGTYTPTASRVFRIRIMGEVVGGQGSPGN